jgi:hypothetical protein
MRYLALPGRIRDELDASVGRAKWARMVADGLRSGARSAIPHV